MSAVLPRGARGSLHEPEYDTAPEHGFDDRAATARALAARAGWAAHPGWRRLPALLLGAVLLVLVVYPMGMLALGAFSVDGPLAMDWAAPALSTRAFGVLLSDFEILRSVWNTLVIVGASGIVATGVGLFFAWVVVRTDAPWRRSIEVATLLPLFVPPLVAGIAWSFIGSPTTGLLNVALGWAGLDWRVNFYSLPGLVFVFGLYSAPYVYLFVRPALEGTDASLEEAAAICGAGQATLVRTITLPLILPSILAGSLLSFVIMLSTYGIPAALGLPARIPMLATTLYRLVTGTPSQYDVAAALALLLIALSSLLICAKQWLLRGRSYVTINAKARPQLRIRLGRWRGVVLAAAAAYLLVVSVLPTLVLGLASLRRFLFFADLASVFDASQYSLEHFRNLLDNPTTLRSIANALQLGLSTALIGGALAFVFGYVVYRSRLPGRRALEVVASLPLAIPGIAVGVAYLWAWMGLPINLYGTVAIMALALVARFLPDAMQALSAVLMQIHRDLEEASWTCGRGIGFTLARIVVPLARPGIAASAILLFVLAVRELGSTMFLYISSTIPLSVHLLNYFEAGNISATAALCVIQMLFLVVVLLVTTFISRRVAGPARAATATAA